MNNLQKKYIELQYLVEEIIDNRGKSVPTEEEGIPLIATNCIKHSSIYPTFENIRFISEYTHKNWFRAHLKPNDILFVNKGTPGRVCLVPDPINFCAAQDMVGLRFKKEIDYRYALAVLRSNEIQKYISNNHVGLVIAHLRKKELLQLKLPIIDFITQKKIGKLYFDLSQKIETNNKMNAELEAMAKTLYDYWFVQFDFLDVNGKPYKSFGGKMVYNKELKREIPEGWDVKSINFIGEIVGGSTPDRGNDQFFSKDGIQWITPKDLSLNAGNKFISRGEIDVTIAGKNKACLAIMPRGTVMMSSRAPVGYLAIARNPVTSNQGFKSFVPKSYFTTEYIYYTIQHLLPVIKNNATGSTFKEVSASVLKTIYTTIPTCEIIKSFKEKIGPIFSKQELLEEENIQLSKLRDWLLPMLMNGQVTVGEDYKETIPDLNIVVDPQIAYKISKSLDIPENKKAFAKQVLGGKIVSLFKDDTYFTDIKFQKIQFLAEHIAEVDLNLNYYYQIAGPYDPKFMHSVYNKLKENRWFEKQNKVFIPLAKQDKVNEYYEGYFSYTAEKLNQLFKLLINATEAESEIIATLYAVWNNRLIQKEPTDEVLLVEDFYNWSDRKKQYSATQITEGLEWLRNNKMEPKGFGKLIRRKKK